MPNELIPAERRRLADLEQAVERGLQTFHEVGSALLEIRDERLYRETHKTFEDYCRERFGFSGSRGRQLIAATRTVTAVTERGLPAPKSEREARELARQLRAEADRLDGGRKAESLATLERASALIRQGDEQLRLAIAELDDPPECSDPEVLAAAAELRSQVLAFLDEAA
jgi:hypothetical protein